MGFSALAAVGLSLGALAVRRLGLAGCLALAFRDSLLLPLPVVAPVLLLLFVLTPAGADAVATSVSFIPAYYTAFG